MKDFYKEDILGKLQITKKTRQLVISGKKVYIGTDPTDNSIRIAYKYPLEDFTKKPPPKKK